MSVVARDRVVLEKFNVTARKIFAGHALASMRLSRWHEERVDRTVFELSTELMSEVTGVTKRGIRVQFEKDVTHKKFASWWSHFRHTFFPKWLLRRFPPKYSYSTETVYDARYVHVRLLEKYPKLPTVFPECGHSFPHIDYRITEDSSFREVFLSEHGVPRIEVEIKNHGKVD